MTVEEIQREDVILLKQRLEEKLEAIIYTAQIASVNDHLRSRELSLAITKLEEAQMWAERIPVPEVEVPDMRDPEVKVAE